MDPKHMFPKHHNAIPCPWLWKRIIPSSSLLIGDLFASMLAERSTGNLADGIVTIICGKSLQCDLVAETKQKL